MKHDTLAAVILGALEGFTEFLPVSSTGHMILAGDLLGFQNDVGKPFDVVIQLGAILAVITFSVPRLSKVIVDLPTDPRARRFAWAVIIAFLPAAALGAVFHDFVDRAVFALGGRDNADLGRHRHPGDGASRAEAQASRNRDSAVDDRA
jgi:undecaprenyl-diphosphatase